MNHLPTPLTFSLHLTVSHISGLVVIRIACLFVVFSTFAIDPALAIVRRDNLTDDQVQELAKQGQFAGLGQVSGGGSAVAIAPRWVMTARHVGERFSTPSRQQFNMPGFSSFGDRITKDGTDVSLIYLDNPLPEGTPFIVPNPGHNTVGNLIWKAGRGTFGTVSGPKTSETTFTQRAGTNVVASAGNGLLFARPRFDGETTPSLRYSNSNQSPASTTFEVSTGPGDSGGPMFLQHDNQWFVAGTTIGVGGGFFVDADVAADYDWILQQVRAREGDSFNFAPQAAPTKLTFDRNPGLSGVQSGGAPGFSSTWNNDRPMFYANGFNYTWENDAPPVAVFGTSTTEASVVNVSDAITFSGIEFAPTDPDSGPFQINGNGSLAAISGGAFIEANRFGAIGANLTGSNDITKTGAEGITLTGDNISFDGQFVITDGFVRINAAEALGTSGFVAGKKTVIQDGATLQLTGSGISSAEHFHITGEGDLNNGAIFVSGGNHTLTERIALQGNAKINVNANASLTIGGDQPGDVGRFYEGRDVPGQPAPPRTLTQDGEGIVVYDQTNPITRLAVINGVAAGDGTIGGTLALTTGAELRPGDSAVGSEYGTFSAQNYSMDSDSILSIDLDPESMLADLVDVTGTINLAGTLNLNLFSAPSEGDEFMIFENGGTDAVVGFFASGNQVSAMFGGEGYNFAVNYAAGTGNDVFLSFTTAIPEPSTFTLLGIVALGAASRRRKSCR